MAYIYDLSDQWNAIGTTFTGIKMSVTDTASASGSLLMDLQVGGSSRFNVTKGGTLSAQAGSAAAPGYGFGTGGVGVYSRSTARVNFATTGGFDAGVEIGNNLLVFASTSSLSWVSGTLPSSGIDLILARDAANTLAQRNGVNAQAFNLYNTYTDASNYERLGLRWSGNDAIIGVQVAGTGTFRQLHHVGATHRFFVGSTGSTFAWNIEQTGNLVAQTGVFVGLAEMTAPAAPAANGVRIYAEDDGAGKTRLMARFATGAAVQIAIEP